MVSASAEILSAISRRHLSSGRSSMPLPCDEPFPNDCILKAVALKPSIGMIASVVKRTHKGPLRDILARNMRRLRAARGLSQEALAHESGVNRTYLSSVERAERNVSIDNIARIAEALAVEPWKLL